MEKTVSFLGIQVRTSPIHGRGLFATHFIPEGMMVAEYVGDRITWDEGLRREALGGGDYLFDVEGRFMIDGEGFEVDAARMNHACEPNCDVEIVENRVFIVTARAILPGEELTYDYGFDLSCAAGKDPRQVFPCHCGAIHCRGTLVDLDPMDPPA